MKILGISCFYHDSAAALLVDGEIVATAQEERFTRKKHDAGFPENAVRYCLAEAGISAAELGLVAFYEKLLVRFDRLLTTFFTYAPRGLRTFLTAMPLWLTNRIWMKQSIRRALSGYSRKILFPEHHESHAAAAFYPSPFEEAAVLTLDGAGENTTTTYGMGRGNSLDIFAQLTFPHSLGLLYSAFTCFTGFNVNSAEYKIMDLKPDGSFRLNMEYFDYCAGLRMTSGVALNCVANGRVMREVPFKQIWIQPAAGDAGGALGAAYMAWHQYLDQPRVVDGSKDRQKASCLGPAFSDDFIERFLEQHQLPFRKLTREAIPERISRQSTRRRSGVWFKRGIDFIVLRPLLFILFLLFFVPVGLVLRLLKRDPLGQQIQKNTESYWRPRILESTVRQRLERMS
jgi:carbamoyltransferase